MCTPTQGVWQPAGCVSCELVCVCVSLVRAVIICLASTHTALVSSPSLTVLHLPTYIHRESRLKFFFSLQGAEVDRDSEHPGPGLTPVSTSKFRDTAIARFDRTSTSSSFPIFDVLLINTTARRRQALRSVWWTCCGHSRPSHAARTMTRHRARSAWSWRRV